MRDHEPGDTTVEALRRANPVPIEEAVSRRSYASAHALYSEVVAQPRRRHIPRRALLLAAVIVLVALMVMAFVVVRRQSTVIGVASACYASDSLAAARVIAEPSNPEQACAKAWADGDLGRGPVPDFDVCVLPAGVLAVFPGESGSICTRLDLPEYSGNNSLDRFANSINGQVSSACIGLRPAERIIRREIARRHLSGWRVERRPGGFDAARPCASVAIDPAVRTVFVVAIANPFVVAPSTEP